MFGEPETGNPDNNPDKVAGFGFPQKLMPAKPTKIAESVPFPASALSSQQSTLNYFSANGAIQPQPGGIAPGNREHKQPEP